MAKTLKAFPTPESEDTLTPQLLGKYVRARRTQLGFKLEEAAAFCHVAKDTLMKLEHGQSTLQLGSALQICKALGIQLAVLSWETKDEQDVWV